MPAIPRDDADDLDWLLFRQDGVISRRQALRLMPEATLRRLVTTGRWTRRHYGIFVAHNGQLTPEQRRWIGVLAGGGPLAGQSALTVLGLRGYDTNSVHVYIPERRRVTEPPAFVIVHRTRGLEPPDRHNGSPPCTAPSRSVIDAAQWAHSNDKARAIIAAAFQQRLVDGDGMRAALARLTRVHRRALIAATIRDATEGAESISELDFLNLCRRGRLPLPTRQSVVADASGRRRYRDAYFEEWRVHVEIDGGQHMEVASWWADMQRQNAMWVAGDRVLRFPAWAVRNEPDKVIATVRAALTAAGWHP